MNIKALAGSHLCDRLYSTVSAIRFCLVAECVKDWQ